jgi:hypothetical protein
VAACATLQEVATNPEFNVCKNEIDFLVSGLLLEGNSKDAHISGTPLVAAD